MTYKFFTSLQRKAVLSRNGTYFEVPLYSRDQEVYAKSGVGFVRMRKGGTTSNDKIFWRSTDLPTLDFNRLGYMATPNTLVPLAA